MIAGGLRRGVGWLGWYLREVSGESAYERYLAHARTDHPDDPVRSRRDFERLRMDARNSRPESRCC